MVRCERRCLYRVAHALSNRSGARYQSSGPLAFAGGFGHRTHGVLHSTALAGSSRDPSTPLAWAHTLPGRARVTGLGGEHTPALRKHATVQAQSSSVIVYSDPFMP